MPTLVGILTFISRIKFNTTSEILKSKNVFIFQYFTFHEQLKCSSSVESCMKKSFITSGPGVCICSEAHVLALIENTGEKKRREGGSLKYDIYM